MQERKNVKTKIIYKIQQNKTAANHMKYVIIVLTNSIFLRDHIMTQY